MPTRLRTRRAHYVLLVASTCLLIARFAAAEQQEFPSPLKMGTQLAAQQSTEATADTLWPDLVQLNVKVGGGTFSYSEESTVASGRFNGKVLLGELRGGIRLTERIRFSLAATAAFTGSDTEEFTRAISTTGSTGTSLQENDLSLTLFLIEPDFRYRVLQYPHVDMDVVVGWGAAALMLERRQLIIDGTPVTGSFEESFVAHGPRVGVSSRITIPQLPRALSFVLDATYNNFIGVNVESDFLDSEAFTRGFGVKWNVGFQYHVLPRFTFGFGYQGMLLEIDRSDRVGGGAGSIRQGGQVPANTSRVDALYLNLHWNFGQ